MKKGLIIGIVVVVIIILVGGYYLYAPKNVPVYNSTQNVPVNVNQTENTANTTGNIVSNQTSAVIETVTIENYAFNPSTININVGETVTWTNKDSAPHRIVSDSGNELGSNTLSNGGTYSHTFTVAGTYDYHCSIHTSMKGKVIVA